MKLLVVSLNGDPSADLGGLHTGGQCKYILELGKNLVGMGWDIDVLTLVGDMGPGTVTITEGFTVHRMRRPSGLPYGYDLTLEEVVQLADQHPLELGPSHYRVVLLCYWLSGAYWSRVDRSQQIPRLLTLCSLGFFKRSVEDTPEIATRIEWERRSVAESDYVIATNTLEQEVLETFYEAEPSKVHLIPRGVRLDLFEQLDEVPLRW